MDKSWIHLSRTCKAYHEGARRFVDMVQASNEDVQKTQCPCNRCMNLQHHNFDTVDDHLIINGMHPRYTTWVFHGKKSNILEDANMEFPETYNMYKDALFEDDDVIEPTDERTELDLKDLVEEVELPLYSGCTITTMFATVILYKYKARYSLSLQEK